MKRALLAPVSEIRKRDRLAPPWPGREHLVDDQRLFVRQTPATSDSAEPALYIHGLGGSSQNWTDLADVLSDRLAGQAIDLPGFGHSAPSTKYTIPALAQRVAAWIGKSDRGPVHLFGNSLGGAISVYLAATRPQLVRTLTLISPAMPFADVRRSTQSRFLPLLAIPRADRLAARAMAGLSPEQVVDQVTANCWGEPDCLPDQRRLEAIDEVRRRMSVPWNSQAYVRTFRALVGSFLQSYLPGSSSLWRMAGQVKAPTLVVWGNLDRLVNVGLAPQVGRTIPDSRLLILDKVGHVAMMERPEIVGRAFLAMLDETRDTNYTQADVEE
ncbi:pimeloyl-ACP methyl ester carboxylesterase [Stackebrandtia albiflava]|uniref:Pimeloyl-ACP methyl ester carboxylesterase n=1 Tax=Stackebrandtia albiflava TaxID=406432 RepID=A0A562V4T8_9ACTN|nr:alpha/beta hydrolase [Stackebrandtia albiflava]TWJ12890.1 pimeloyl-ACP methyl ester carboxylesterase [Stackebrandtia albiflava]